MNHRHTPHRDAPGTAPRPLRPGDLHATAELHRRELPHGFFARLGESFLRTYHRTFDASPHGVALVTRDGAGVTGMILGTIDNPRHYRWTARHHGARLALVGSLALLRRPRSLVTFVRTRLVRYTRAAARALSRGAPPGGGGASSHDEPTGSGRVTAVLVHVAVNSTTRRHGTGRALVEAFVEACRQRGSTEIRLITPANGPAVGFYTALGWQHVVDRKASDGTWVTEFRFVVDRHDSPTGGEP